MSSRSLTRVGRWLDSQRKWLYPIRGQDGWTYVELIVAMAIFTLLIAAVYPVLTVFKTADVEKKARLYALWLGQDVIERHIADVPGEQTGEETVQAEQITFNVKWERTPTKGDVEKVDVTVSWKIAEKKERTLFLERYVVP